MLSHSCANFDIWAEEPDWCVLIELSIALIGNVFD